MLNFLSLETYCNIQLTIVVISWRHIYMLIYVQHSIISANFCDSICGCNFHQVTMSIIATALAMVTTRIVMNTNAFCQIDIRGSLNSARAWWLQRGPCEQRSTLRLTPGIWDTPKRRCWGGVKAKTARLLSIPYCGAGQGKRQKYERKDSLSPCYDVLHYRSADGSCWHTFCSGHVSKYRGAVDRASSIVLIADEDVERQYCHCEETQRVHRCSDDVPMIIAYRLNYIDGSLWYFNGTFASNGGFIQWNASMPTPQPRDRKQ